MTWNDTLMGNLQVRRNVLSRSVHYALLYCIFGQLNLITKRYSLERHPAFVHSVAIAYIPFLRNITVRVPQTRSPQSILYGIEHHIEETSRRGQFQHPALRASCTFRSVGLAAIKLLKILNSSLSQYVDFDAGKRLFNSAMYLIRRSSVEDNDLAGRSSKILTQLWVVHNSLTARREQEPRLRINTRLSASLLHDSLWLWREEFGGQANAYREP